MYILCDLTRSHSIIMMNIDGLIIFVLVFITVSHSILYNLAEWTKAAFSMHAPSPVRTRAASLSGRQLSRVRGSVLLQLMFVLNSSNELRITCFEYYIFIKISVIIIWRKTPNHHLNQLRLCVGSAQGLLYLLLPAYLPMPCI